MDESEKDAMASKKCFPKGKYAGMVKVGERGQIVIPKEARQMFDIQPGDTLIILGDEKHGLAIPPKEQFDELTAKVFEKSEVF